LSRAQLLDAAEEIFGHKGFHATTLKEIAELAEFSVGSVYSFFESKEDLFRQIFQRRREEFMPAVRAVVEGDGLPMQVLRALVDYEVSFFRKHPHFGRLYLRQVSPSLLGVTVMMDEYVRSGYEEAIELRAELFARGQREKVFRAGDPVSLSRMLSGMVSAFQSQDPAVVDDLPAEQERLTLETLHQMIEAAFAGGAVQRVNDRRTRRTAAT
jgi:AcrR family transcriptional regulator